MMPLAALLLCIPATETQNIGNMTVAYMQRFEPCPVVEQVKFAPQPKYPSAKECKENPKLERCG